jgi:hypothetical protein
MNPSSGVVARATWTFLLASATVAPRAVGQGVPDSTSDSTAAQVDHQLWMTFRAMVPRWSRRIVFRGDVRGSAGGDDPFYSVDGRIGTNFYPLSWMDVYPEMQLRRTHETEGVDNTMLDVSGGLRFQLPVTQISYRDRAPLHRLHASTFLRAEWRYFWYTGGTRDSSWRLRARAAGLFSINHAQMGTDQTLHAQGDAEVFVPLGDEPSERYANRWRFRGGLGYRFNFAWRALLLGIVQRSRNTIDQPFTTTTFMLSLGVDRYF